MSAPITTRFEFSQCGYSKSACRTDWLFGASSMSISSMKRNLQHRTVKMVGSPPHLGGGCACRHARHVSVGGPALF